MLQAYYNFRKLFNLLGLTGSIAALLLIAVLIFWCRSSQRWEGIIYNFGRPVPEVQNFVAVQSYAWAMVIRFQNIHPVNPNGVRWGWVFEHPYAREPGLSYFCHNFAPGHIPLHTLSLKKGTGTPLYALSWIKTLWYFEFNVHTGRLFTLPGGIVGYGQDIEITIPDWVLSLLLVLALGLRIGRYTRKGKKEKGTGFVL